MKFSLSWLQEYLDFESDLNELSKKLTMIGLEVEEIIDEAKIYENIKVAKIIEASKHPNSDKLNICKAEDGDGAIHQIVCGAKNARSGIKVAMASISAIVPLNQMVIKKAKIAGVESCGMMCSARELNLGLDEEGIIEIDEKWQVGTEISEVFNKNDAIIDVNITPNRGDCLGVYGIARDLASCGFGKLKNLEIKQNKVDFLSKINVKISAENDCKIAVFRQIKNVKNCKSPDWLQEKLEKIGQNSISAVVDILNYTMFSLNRPMHSYNLKKIVGEIEIRKAKKGEKFISLKNQEYLLDEEILVVADKQNVIAVAGVIGSLDSSCEEGLCDILLEAAFFDKVAVAKSGRKLNILSESRYRFERGVDYKDCVKAIEFATSLISEICGGEIGEISEFKSSEFQEKNQEIEFNFVKIKKLIGIEVEKEIALKILQNLGFVVKENDAKIIVEIPSYRSDIENENDLIEEIIRIYGYDKITPQPINADFKKPQTHIFDKIRQDLIAKGFVENINWSFCDAKIAQNFGDLKEELHLLNPISENLNYMRPNLVIGLLNSYKKNHLRGIENAAVFEIGNVFENADITGQKYMISGLRAGKNKEQNHYNDARNFDIFDVKKDIFDLFEIFSLQEKSVQIYDEDAPKYYHPHRFGVLKLGKNIVGYFGEIHPRIAKIFDIKDAINVFEIFVDALPVAKSAKKKPFEINDLQPIYRDFAFLLDLEQKIGDLTKTIAGVDKKLIQDVEIFDIYRGQNIAEGKKSVALRVMIQPCDKSLTGEEIDEISQKIIKEVSLKNQAQLRS